MAGWRLPSSPASASLMRPHTQRGRKGVTTMPPACVVSLPFCPKELIHVAALTPDNQKVKFSKGGVLILEGVPSPGQAPPSLLWEVRGSRTLSGEHCSQEAK